MVKALQPELQHQHQCVLRLLHGSSACLSLERFDAIHFTPYIRTLKSPHDANPHEDELARERILSVSRGWEALRRESRLEVAGGTFL